MSNKLIQITAYYCKYCGKVFRKKRHFCFSDPDNKACKTCYGWNGYEYEYERDENGESIDVATCGIVLDKVINSDLPDSCEIDFGNYHGRRGYNCPYYINRQYAQTLEYLELEKLRSEMENMYYER
jgi:hypothetical protein